MQTVSVLLFGAPQIWRQDQLVEVDTRKAMALLAYLAVTGVPHSRDSLAVLLYPDLDQHHARAALRRTISALKQSLEPTSLILSGSTLSIEVGGNLSVDARYFSQLVDEWKSHKHIDLNRCEECRQRLEAAIELYRGDFLTGFTLRDSANFDDWQFFQTESFRKELAGIFGQLVPALCVEGAFDRAIGYARRWLSLDSLNEEAHRALMRCYALSGQQSAALRQYRECVKVLERELGVPPVEETTQLYRNILEHQLKPHNEKTSEVVTVSTKHVEGSVSQSATSFPLVGRQAELEEIRWSYQWSATKGCFFLIEGEMGIGKTRLVEEFLNSVPIPISKILRSRCFDGESQLAYAPFFEGLQTLYPKNEGGERLKGMPESTLSQASLLIPEIGVDFSDIPDPSSIPSPTQANFFEGLRRIILRILGTNPPGIIYIDDLQWADAASLDLLAYLIRRLDKQPLFILCTWRNEGTSNDRRIHQILAEAQRYGTGVLQHLGRLSEENFLELVSGAIKSLTDSPEAFSSRLYHETEGVPFLAVEYLTKLIMESDRKDGVWINIDDWNLPENVREAMQARLSQVSDIEWQLLTAGAVLGRSFGFNNLMFASGRSETETLTGLEELQKRGIVRERLNSEVPGNVEFDFTHEKIRQLVYEQTSLSRRRIMHRRVAEVLTEGSHGSRKSNVAASTIAQHFLLAGELDKAAEYYYLAGEISRSLFAHRQAEANFRAALTYGYPDEAGIYAAIGDSLTMLGEYKAALDSYNSAIAFSPPEVIPTLELKLGNIHHRLGEYELAACFFKTAVESLSENEDAAILARVYADWSRSAFFMGDIVQAQNYADQALALAEQVDEKKAIAHVQNILGILARHAGRLDIAKEHLERSLEISRKLEDVMIIPAALNNLAFVYANLGDIGQAVSLIEEALSHCERIGDRHLEAALHNNLADFLHDSGETEKAMEHLRKAVVIFAEIGVQAGEVVPEVWKLSEW